MKTTRVFPSVIAFLEAKVPSYTKRTYVLAVSGGADSMLMLDCFRLLGLSVVVAHVNYKLRGEASDLDQQVVEHYCKKYSIDCYCKTLDEDWKLSLKGANLQHEARKVRYQWFEELRIQNKFSYICTAHHLNDQAETILFHLLRGSSLKGLKGISDKNGHILRPLLMLLKDDIYEACLQNDIPYREDASNQEIDYDRNKIRNVLIPEIKAMNPAFPIGVTEQARCLQEAEFLWNKQIKRLYHKHVRSDSSAQRLSCETVSAISMGQSLFMYWLQEHGFTLAQTQDAFSNGKNWQTGRRIESGTHSLIKDRGDWLMVQKELSSQVYQTIQQEDKEIFLGLNKILIREEIFHAKNIVATDIYLHSTRVEYPLIIRNWKSGDYFYPFGLNKKKKVSDFLTDQKISTHERRNVLVMLSGERICWVIGLRSDHRFGCEEGEPCLRLRVEKMSGE